MFKFTDKDAQRRLSFLAADLQDIHRKLGYVPSGATAMYLGAPPTVDEQLRALRNDLEAVIEHLGLEHVSQTVTPPHLRKKTRRALRKG